MCVCFEFVHHCVCVWLLINRRSNISPFACEYNYKTFRPTFENTFFYLKPGGFGINASVFPEATGRRRKEIRPPLHLRGYREPADDIIVMHNKGMDTFK